MGRNEAGGYTFLVDDWLRLDRFLILGTAGGTYYSGERELTLENAAVVRRCIAQDGPRTVARIAEISDAGRAPKNDPAILALAMAAKLGDDRTRTLAYDAVPMVCRIGTHIFDFAAAIDAMGGWGRGARRAIATWYATRGRLENEPERYEDETAETFAERLQGWYDSADQRHAGALAYQLVKYRQRNGWTHRDLLRLSHATPSPLLAWAAGKGEADSEQPILEIGLPAIIGAFEDLQAHPTDVKRAVELITVYRLPWEVVPTELHDSPEVWAALLEAMPPTALLRNLGRLTRLGVVKPFSDGLKRAVATLTSAERLSKARVHPMAVLLAGRIYGQGHGIKGATTWTPVQQINDALDDAFYAAMASVPQDPRRTLVAVDVSGSMFHATVADYPITAGEAAAAMAMVIARSTPEHFVLGFTTRPIALEISPRMRFHEAVAAVRQLRPENTDASVPMRWCEAEGLKAETIVALTDNATWAGSMHPAVALESLRKNVAPGLRFIDCAFTPTTGGIGDTVDPLTLHCVGLDSDLPEIVRSFAAGEF
jgi:60 kDa SS-A/Ro ribonucleoprotein